MNLRRRFLLLDAPLVLLLAAVLAVLAGTAVIHRLSDSGPAADPG